MIVSAQVPIATRSQGSVSTVSSRPFGFSSAPMPRLCKNQEDLANARSPPTNNLRLVGESLYLLKDQSRTNPGDSSSSFASAQGESMMSASIHCSAVGLFAFAALCLGLSSQSGSAQNKEQIDKADKDLALIQGSWQVTSFTEDGVKFGESETAQVKLVIKGNALTLVGMGDDKQATFKIDSSKKPKQVDVFPEGGGPDKFACIYELTAETLKICGAADGPRPTEFKSEAGGETLLIEFKRTDAKKAKVQEKR
jgi:uncharacterized protein (TIGR03067 family)